MTNAAPAGRRRTLAGLGAASAVMLVSAPALPAPREIRIVARKFEFEPHVVRLRLGEAVVLVLSTADRIHGFKAPGLGLAAELPPGKEVRLPLTPTRVGEFAFVCDVFCGEGHDEMDGKLLVEG